MRDTREEAEIAASHMVREQEQLAAYRHEAAA